MGNNSSKYRNILHKPKKTINKKDPIIIDKFEDDIDTKLIQYIYPNQLVPHSREDSEKRIQQYSESSIWKWQEFTEILTNLVYIAENKYIPAANIPKIIYIDGLIPIITNLIRISKGHNKVEISRSIFVDRERFCLIQSGRTKIGQDTSVNPDFTTEMGRDYYQTPIITIHIHPLLQGSFHFSYVDYISFLSVPKIFVMIVSNSEDIMMAIKTSATPTNTDPESIKKHIISTKDDISRIWNRLGIPQYELNLNKTICMEFGLILYKSIKGNTNIMKHINVVEA